MPIPNDYFEECLEDQWESIFPKVILPVSAKFTFHEGRRLWFFTTPSIPDLETFVMRLVVEQFWGIFTEPCGPIHLSEKQFKDLLISFSVPDGNTEFSLKSNNFYDVFRLLETIKPTGEWEFRPDALSFL